MTFWFDDQENVLVGNRVGKYTEVNDEEIRIDVDAIMNNGRGISKLNEMKREIQKAIDANEE